MEHEVYIDAEVETPAAVEEQIRRSVLAALKEEQVDVPCIVAVCVTDDAGIHQTNLEMRGVDRPTDDMMLSLERARAQAEEFGHSPEREVCYLAVHSVLHLLGYDHLDEGPMKAQMREREETILEKLGITREGAE